MKEVGGRGPHTIWETDHQVRGFSRRTAQGGVAVLLDQSPFYQVAAVSHELYHWAGALHGCCPVSFSNQLDEEETAFYFGRNFARSLGF